MSAPTSRLAKMMRARLGDAHWAAFVRHANRHFKAPFVDEFRRRVLRCAGTVDGAPCPHGYEVDLAAEGASLECLHLDHTPPVHATCARWAAQLPVHPAAWDDGVDGGALCHALFGVREDGVHGAACLRFRCGPRKDVAGGRARFAQHTY